MQLAALPDDQLPTAQACGTPSLQNHPDGHAKQLDEPLEEVYVPGAHTMQLAALPDDQLPTAQACLTPSLQNHPDGHAKQMEEPLDEVYVPGGHTLRQTAALPAE